MADDKLNWAMPVMRTGYAGRALVYAIVSGISLFAIWHGEEAKGTSEALSMVERSPFGLTALWVVALGLFAYMGWRLVDAAFDLEDHGSDAKGILARLGQAVTGMIHGALGGLALLLIFGSTDSGEGSKTAFYLAKLMSWPFGEIILGIVAVITMGAGVYYLHKAWTQSYRQKLQANHFTLHWNRLLQAGVAAQGVSVLIIGGLMGLAAWQHDPQAAGGLDKAFGWLGQQIYGQVLVTAMCVGLALFALFMAVNAVYRIIPRLKDPDVMSLATKVKQMADGA
ncbi:DUF1206 domain-containing protein [Loktanella sp. M215]|uniref:DUF1206 domain-containing protein n=1 Tax=Loktanella sp. M215 TaxID=2675431 RepID=UPI001F460F8C|nr:DUF1206 domain-containing protein [Loktanella sp. M215]MCF7700197.1 DUF1206 domain-containing protein [Loktanella sp. M215]